MSNTKPKCCGEVVQNTIFGKSFWYCRGCKQEVKVSSLQDSLNYVTDMIRAPDLTFRNGIVSTPSGTLTAVNGRIVIPTTAQPQAQYTTHTWVQLSGRCAVCGALCMPSNATSVDCPGPNSIAVNGTTANVHLGNSTITLPPGASVNGRYMITSKPSIGMVLNCVATSDNEDDHVYMPWASVTDDVDGALCQCRKFYKVKKTS